MKESTNRRVLEKVFTDLQEARTAYTTAVQEYKRLLECCQDLGLAKADADTALRQAMALQNSALEHYHEGLRTFTDLVLHGETAGEQKKAWVK